MSLDVFTAKLGSEQLRIQPTGWTSVSGSYICCLGNDVAGRAAMLEEGDHVEIAQTASLGSSVTLRFSARTRAPSQLPKVVMVTSAVASALYRVTINGTHYDYTALAADSEVGIAVALVDVINTAGDGFAARLTGAADQLQLTADDPSTTYTVAVVGNLSTGTFAWKAKLLIDGNLRFEQELRAGYTRDRADGGAMVNNERLLGGTHEVLFRLELEGTLSGSVAELELPAFYVDNVTIEP